MRVNSAVAKPIQRTHEGAPAKRITSAQQLRRSVLSCLLWEREFYEDGVSIANRIAELVPKVDKVLVADLAIQARTEFKLRHVPLLLCRELARHGSLRAETLCAVIQRADELAEFLAIYWLGGRCSLSAQVKKGLAMAFKKFSAYSLAKYDRDGVVKLRDVLFLTHPKPKDDEQAQTWKKLIEGKLSPPDTWEVALSGGADKKEAFTRLLAEKKLGALALLRNLRNMTEAKVPHKAIADGLAGLDVSRVLPFRFLAAAKYAPGFESEIEAAMLRSLSGHPKLSGKTVIVVDVSGSMYGQSVSRKSDIDRAQAACALAIFAREICEDVAIYATAGNDGTRRHKTELCPSRRGFALSDYIYGRCRPLGGGGIFLTPVMRWINEREEDVDRVIVFTDEQDCAIIASDSPNHAPAIGQHNYLVNVASYQNGVGYGQWVHQDGFSEGTIRWILEYERGQAAGQML